MRFFTFTCFYVLFQYGLHAQNLRIDSLLLHVLETQRSFSDSDYSAGLIPSQRIYLKQKRYKKEDDNIFFTALVVWTLRSQRSKLTEANQRIVDSISARAIRNFPLYRNKNGDCTYNFWFPKRHFPNDKFFSKRKKYALPDDLDDTSILYLSERHPDSLVKCFKQKMVQHANGNEKIIHNTFRRYRYRKAYNTWFGKRMPVDFDLCVQCNAILWVLGNGWELNEYDRETIRLIQDIVLSDGHLKYAHYLSPHYQNPSVVLYHLARLVSIHPESFPLINKKLVKDIENQFNKRDVPMERLLLNTSLARFGLPQKDLGKLGRKDFDSFYFFVANMTSVFPNPIKRWFAKSKWTNFYYQSEGYYWSLLLENECFKVSNCR